MPVSPEHKAHSPQVSQTIRAVLFDHDGTLVDSEPLHFKLWSQVLGHYGVDLSEEIFNTHHAGLPTIANALDIVNRFSIEQSPEVLVEQKNQVTQAYLARDAYPLMPGVEKTIMCLHEMGLEMGVVTGANNYSVGSTLRTYPFARHFSVVVSADDVNQTKPAPDCYLLAIKKLGLPPEQCLAIEDTAHGMQAALQARIRCLVIPTEVSRHHDFTGAKAVLDNMEQALAYIQKTNQ